MKIKGICIVLLSASLILSGLSVNAFAAGSIETQDNISDVQKADASSKPKIDSIETKKNSDGSVTFTVNATGGEDVGTGLLFYKFYNLDKNGKKIAINQNEGIGQNYSLSNKYKYQDAPETKCGIFVEVENSENEKVSTTKYFVDSSNSGNDEDQDQQDNNNNNDQGDNNNDQSDNQGNSEELTVSIKSNTSSYKIGRKVKFSATSSGGDGEIEYKFYIKSDAEDSTSGAYSTNSSYYYTIENSGSYKVFVKAKDKNGIVTSKTISFKVSEDNSSNPGSSSDDNNDQSNSGDVSNALLLVGALGMAGAIIIKKSRK